MFRRVDYINIDLEYDDELRNENEMRNGTSKLTTAPMQTTMTLPDADPLEPNDEYPFWWKTYQYSDSTILTV